MLPDCHRTHHPLCRSSLCQPDTPCRRTPATVQSGKSHLRPRPHCKQLPGRTLRLSILPCLQFFRTGILSGLPVPQTMAEPFHSFMGHAELLYAHLPGSALSGRRHSRCHHRMLRSSIHVLFTEENSKRRFFWKSETYGNHDLRRATYNYRNSGLRFNHGIMNPLCLPLSELKHLPYFR